MKNFFTTLILGCTIGTLSAQLPLHTETYLTDEGRSPRERVLDMEHLRLQVSFEPVEGKVNGIVTHFFTPLRQRVDSFFLDGPGISITEAFLNGKPVRYQQQNDGYWFYPATPLTSTSSDSLSITYHAYPQKGIYFIGWNDPRNKARKQIWTQGQGIDNRHWIPSFDQQNDKLTTETIIRFDSTYKVLSNGDLLGKKAHPDGTITWHYKMSKPHTTYLVMLGIGDYRIRSNKSRSGVPLHFWYYPEYEPLFDYAYRYSERMMDFFEDETGVAYPWNTYSQIPVADFMYGAMENTTATLFGDFFLVDERSWNDRNYVQVNAHELAHQWFGDYVTAWSGTHHWLQESFATYYSYLFDRIVFGPDVFDWDRRNAVNISLNEGRKNALPVAHSNAGTARWYPKGAMVLHMLRYVVGEEHYRKAITHYLKTHPYANVNSDDLLVAFHESTGYSLDWFWDQWIYRGGEPYYKVSQELINRADGSRKINFTVAQTQEVNELQPLFRMPVWFQVHYKDGTYDSLLVNIDQQTQTVVFELGKNREVSYTLFDPGSQVLKSLDFDKPTEQWVNQATGATFMLDRYDAVKALESRGIAENYKLFAAILKSDEFHAIKGEIIRQAASVQGDDSAKLIALALKDDDPQVQKAVARHVNEIQPAFRKDFEKLLTGQSYETIELALRKLSRQYPEAVAEYFKRTEGLTGTRGSNVLVTRLELMAGVDTSYLAQLVDLTSVSNEFITRTNAMQALQRLNYLNDEATGHMIHAIRSPNNRLSNPAAAVLNAFYEQSRYRVQINAYLDKADIPAGEKEKLRLRLGS